MGTIIIASDGSDLAIRAASAGLAVLRPSDNVLVATVVDGTYPGLTKNDLGYAGDTTGGRSANLRDELLAEGKRIVELASSTLDQDVETRVIEGNPGIALCELAKEVSAEAIVIGPHGHGGVRRALLGSVSDYVVRHAECPVVTVRFDADKQRSG